MSNQQPTLQDVRSLARELGYRCGVTTDWIDLDKDHGDPQGTLRNTPEGIAQAYELLQGYQQTRERTNR